jgi:pyruvate,water dikinase
MEVKKRGDSEEYVKWFYELSNKDVPIAGGKGASLSEMYNSKFPVPPGFVITAQAFDYFLKKNGIKERIKEIIENIETEDTKELEKKSQEIRRLVESQEIPEDLKKEIVESYHILGAEKVDKSFLSRNALNILRSSSEPIFVSVRSSATAEDLADASFAGQQESFLNVKEDNVLLKNIKKCFSSLYTPRAIYYRHKKGFGKKDNLLAVVIQKMVDSEKSGVIFSKDPTNQTEDIIIEAVYGLGEGIVSGRINPDNYSISRDLKIKNVKIADKKIAITRDSSGKSTIVKLTPERSKSQVLNNGKILELANYALKLEEHYKKPQDIEFAIEADKIYIVQSRPVTTLKAKTIQAEISGKVLLTGQGASPGIAVGIVKIIKNLEDLDKVKKGDVLVTEMTNPDMVVSMQRANAIVTNEGGLTSHAAIVSREMGIPAVVGTSKATSLLKDEMKITVDGTNGKVYEGEVAETKFAEIKPVVSTSRVKIKLILDLPEFAERAAESKIDSVGLLRLEGIIAGSGKHPLQFQKENKLDDYTDILKHGIEKIASHFNNIWVRTSDIRTDEFNLLKGAPEKELNPMLGFHGIRFSLKNPKIFEAELLAISKVAEKNSNKKFGVMIPQVISAEEVKQAKEFFNKYKKPNMVFGVMIETPAAVQIIEDICKEGISFVSFGTNDLTQFTLALDRGNENVQYLYNEMHASIFSQIKRVIGACIRYKVETSICGQAGSKKEMAEFLFKKGINSISVNADAAYDISNLISQLEKERESNFQIQSKTHNSQMQVQQKPEQIYHQEHQHIQKPNQNIKHNQGFLNRDKIKIPAEMEELDDSYENIDNLEHLKEKAENIQEEVWKENQEKIKEQIKKEECIKVEKMDIIDTKKDEPDRISVKKKDFSWYGNEYG